MEPHLHARPAHPNRWQSRRWTRACALLLVLSVALQGSVTAMTRAAEPAHVHAQSVASPDRDPMLDGVRVVQNHHATSPHHHAEVERHAHDAALNGVIHVDDDDATAAESVKGSNGKRAAADLDTPTVNLPPPAPLMPCGERGTTPPCDFTSHIDARLERPPR